jgi:hypothetical protein
MRAFFAVALREVRERAYVFAAAAIVGALALAIPFFRPDLRSWTAVVLGAAFVGALAIGLGASTLAPSMASRHIGFDLARPVSSLALWSGRLAAALGIALLSAAIVSFPAFLAGARVPWNDIIVDGRPPRFAGLVATGGFLVLVAAAHAASIALRSRSGLIAVDAALAIAAGFGLAAALSRLPTFLGYEPRDRAIGGFILTAGIGLLVAGFSSVERGRTEIRAAHRALSATLWTSIAIGLAGVIGWTAWVRTASPRDFQDGYWLSPAPAGSWVQLGGRARAASATFLYDTASGRFERAMVFEWARPAFSRDGRHAAWVEGSQGEVRAMSLDAPAGKPVRTRILLPEYPALFVLSHDGSRLATLEKNLLSIHDLAGGRTLATARLDTVRASIRGFFDGPDRFRVYRQPDAGEGKTHLEIFELDVPNKTLSKTGSLERESGSLYLLWNREGNRILMLPELWLADGRTGAILARLSAMPASQFSRWPGFLADGRIILSESSPEGTGLRVFGPDGALQRVIPLPPGRWLSLGGETAPGRVVVAVNDVSAYASFLVDVNVGTVQKLGDGLYPAVRLNGDAFEAAPAVGSDATKLFLERDGMYRLDPETGARTLLLGSDQSGRATQ